MPDRLAITLNNEKVELFMSFGLLNSLVKIIGESEDISQIYVAPELQEAVLKTVLAKRAPSGTPIEEVNLDDFDLSIEDGKRILAWVSEHCLDFLLNGLENAKSLASRNAERVKTLMSSSGGSEA